MTRYNYDWMDQIPVDCNPDTGDLFFPDEPGHGARRQIAAAQSICRTCPVRQPCFELRNRTNTTHGVWAGGAPGGTDFIPATDPEDKSCRVCYRPVESTASGMVQAHLDKAGSPCPGERLPYSTCIGGHRGLKRRVVELTQAGWVAQSIASELGITERTVNRYRKECGIAQSPGRPITGDEIRSARELLAAGKSFAETARILGRHDTSLKRRLRESA